MYDLGSTTALVNHHRCGFLFLPVVNHRDLPPALTTTAVAGGIGLSSLEILPPQFPTLQVLFTMPSVCSPSVKKRLEGAMIYLSVLAVTDTEQDHGKSQARAQMDSIIEMVEAANQAKSERDREEAEQAIYDDPLEVSIRGGWRSPGGEPYTATDYKILLCTGGPAVRIVGELNEYKEPATAKLQYQDWFTPWEYYRLSSEEEETLLDYARRFLFDFE